ncbi:hypothetical protein HORIV_52230 [Vreelandella olivaria]|uniref:SLC26A/SulP transporter domain-containing protein n=1 Tax=Vreelandella olivaria TaxID=390919 RepID=A0ABN5X7K7_9GAMM|nr:hypothetical protein HORIV_52230 [Halomonas olivaria]
MSLYTKQEWFSNIKGDTLSGIVVALALIPEAIAFQSLQALTLKWAFTLHSVSQ